MKYNQAREIHEKVMICGVNIFSFISLYGSYEQFITKNIFGVQTQENSNRWNEYLEQTLGKYRKDIISIDSYNGGVTIEFKTDGDYRKIIWLDASSFQYNQYHNGYTFRVICYGKSDPIVYYLDKNNSFTDINMLNIDTSLTPDNWTNEEWVMFRMCV